MVRRMALVSRALISYKDRCRRSNLGRVRLRSMRPGSWTLQRQKTVKNADTGADSASEARHSLSRHRLGIERLLSRANIIGKGALLRGTAVRVILEPSRTAKNNGVSICCLDIAKEAHVSKC